MFPFLFTIDCSYEIRFWFIIVMSCIGGGDHDGDGGVVAKMLPATLKDPWLQMVSVLLVVPVVLALLPASVHATGNPIRFYNALFEFSME